jgi:hypothetical protein
MTMKLLDPDDIKYIVIHITDSYYGDVGTVNRWHKQKGWFQIGYHFLVLNSFPTKYRWESKRPDIYSDGKIQQGRLDKYQGAHVRGQNWQTIGVAMVGKNGGFSAAQLNSALYICRELKKKFPGIIEVRGHTEFDVGKSCPDLDMELFRDWMRITGK